MGLNFHGTNIGVAYSTFHAIREALFRVAADEQAAFPGHEHWKDVDFESMAGFGSDNSWGDFQDPIKLLLDHSDCDGDLLPAALAAIAPRLRYLAGLARERGLIAPDVASDLCDLAEQMRGYAERNQPLIFC